MGLTRLTPWPSSPRLRWWSGPSTTALSYTPEIARPVLRWPRPVFEVVPGWREDAVPAPFLVVLTPFLPGVATPVFLAGEAFLAAAVFLAGAFCTAVAPSAKTAAARK